jgi:DNA-binding CsgD family transcriptional regulator
MPSIRHKDYLDVHASHTRQELQRNLLNFADRMSFERLTAVLIVEQAGAPKSAHIVGNVPDAFADMSSDVDASLRDPVIKRLKHETRPFMYDQSTYVQVDAGDLWEQQAAFGYKTGISVALHTGSGLHFYLGMDRSRRLPVEGSACARLFADLHLLASYAQEAACRVLAPASPSLVHKPKLSNRELEVLKWVREGKSAWAIGEILGISEHTVEFHCTKARAKMDTSTTHAAVIRAMNMGLL